MNAHEKVTLSRMIRIYCRAKHGRWERLCPECQSLETYSCQRLERCIFAEAKPACRHCPVHCYKPLYKERICEVMHFAGPRMLFFYPIDAIRHLCKEFRG